MTEKRIIQITKLDGYKVHFLYHDGEPRVIDFEELFEEWVSEGDVAYPLKQSLSEFQKISLCDDAFSWSDIKLTNKTSDYSSFTFFYQLSVRHEFTKADDSAEHLGYAIEEFADDIINDCQADNEYLHHKVAFLFLLYITQNSPHLFRIRIRRKGEKVFSSLEEAYHYALKQINTYKPIGIQDSIILIEDKIEKHKIEEEPHGKFYEKRLIDSHLYFVKPIYLQSIKKALKIPHVNDLFGKILLLLGINNSPCKINDLYA